MHMKMSANLKHEIKLHLYWLRWGILPLVVLFALCYSLMPMFAPLPLWGKIFFPALCAVLHYRWWRQCLSPDKKTFKPRIWN